MSTRSLSVVQTAKIIRLRTLHKSHSHCRAPPNSYILTSKIIWFKIWLQCHVRFMATLHSYNLTRPRKTTGSQNCLKHRVRFMATPSSYIVTRPWKSIGFITVWPFGLTIRFDHSFWPFVSTIRFDHSFRPFGLTIRFDHSFRPFGLTIRFDHSVWSTAWITFDLQQQVPNRAF